MENLTEPEAVVGVALSAMYADDMVAAEEDWRLLDRLPSLAPFAGMRETELRAILSKVERLHRQEGERRLLDACVARLPPEMRAVALLLAAEVVMCDDDFAEPERRLLDDLGRRLDLDEAARSRVLAEAADRARHAV